jgi:hypothetical protein
MFRSLVSRGSKTIRSVAIDDESCYCVTVNSVEDTVVKISCSGKPCFCYLFMSLSLLY